VTGPLAVGLTPLETRREIVLHRDTSRRLGFGPEVAVHAGAQLPVLVLPPHRPFDDLDHLLTALAPSTTETRRTAP